MADDLPVPFTTRNLRPRSPATSLSFSAAAASRSHSPSPPFSHQSPYLSIHHPEVESQMRSFSMDHPNTWGTEFNSIPFMSDPSNMNHHIGSSYTSFENNDVFSQPRRSGKKQLFADSPMSAGPSQPGPSTQPFYNPSDHDPAYGMMSSLKRKRDDSLEPIPSWLDDQNTHMSMPMLGDDSSPGPSYISRDRKGKGKEIDYKGKGKQREENPGISSNLLSDSPILNPIAKATRVPSKSPSEPLSSYTCPICFSVPTNATLTPCGHICCGECLFTAVKTVMHRAQQAGAPDAQEARCPVCRALIPDWDGKGGGVIGLKARAIYSL